MGYLLKEALKTLCGVNQWCYAIFWKIGCQNPSLLIWEECYYGPVICSDGGHGTQATNKVHSLVTKMMKDNYINLLGEGLVGRAAFTRNHQWIISDNKMLDVHPPEVSNEVYTQFSAGIQTIAIIPIYPHGVVQLGSSSTVMENMGFVNDVKSLISQLGYVPGALLSESYMKNGAAMDTSQNHRESKVTEMRHSPQCSGSSGHTSFSFSRHIGNNQVPSGSILASPIISQTSTKSVSKKDQQTAFGSFLPNYDSLVSMEQRLLSSASLENHINETMNSRIAKTNPLSAQDARFSRPHLDEQRALPKLTSDKEKLEHELFQALTMSSEEAGLQPSTRDDLFDIVGMNFKNKLHSGNRNNFVNNRVDPNPPSLITSNSSVLEPFSIFEGESDSGIYSSSVSDHLLDAVVCKVPSSSKQFADDNVSCKTSLTGKNLTQSVWANRGSNSIQNELIGGPKCLEKTGGVTSSFSYKSGISKEDGGHFSDSSSIVSSQISSWRDQKQEVRTKSGFSSGYATKSDEISKSNRKRLKPGENPRPRPKDRQMIQDRVKELREIIPNSAKCSIDALLERTIKHMLFLQSVTKHADKLKQLGESKLVGKDGGLLLRDSFEGGATWAYEVGSQSMVCPIVVEDLNSPRHMMVEMLCEERGSFLEIAHIIKGLGLTILKGVMESRNDKIWARFTVEANRDVTRMEIFISLVNLFDQGGSNGALAADCGGNMNTAVDEQSFNQLGTNPMIVIQ